MFENKKIVGIIPARGGSKGIPRKNIINLCGKPLIAYTIEAGLNSEYIDYVMVTTEDCEIAEVSKKYGAEVPFMRPDNLAQDTSKTIDVLCHALESLKKKGKYFDIVVLLQPTQPLRTAKDIDNAIIHFKNNNYISLVSVSEVDDHPILIRSIENGRLKKLLNCSSTCRRQDMPRYYKVNGCIYINNIDEIDENTSLNDKLVPLIPNCLLALAAFKLCCTIIIIPP
ncbi:MAG: acylneuraminate cytidylyltransferase family protein [Lachnospiraceae bacterium]|nr:acylneuraminate cytidylyltransferase family protein [Lachnospiraceae bacterium]